MRGFDLNQEFRIMSKWGLTEAEYLFIKVVYPIYSRKGRRGNCPISYFKDLDFYKAYLNGDKSHLDGIIESLKLKGVLMKKVKLPSRIDSFEVDTLDFTKTFCDDFMTGDYTLGSELMETYPNIGTNENGESYGLRSISKRFSHIYDAFEEYGEAIGWDPEVHTHVLDMIEKGKEKGWLFSTLDRFIIDRGWKSIEAMLEKDKKLKSNMKMV